MWFKDVKYSCLPVFFLLVCFTNSRAGEALPAYADTAWQGVAARHAYPLLNLTNQKGVPGTVVKVAVVDNGFRLSHKALKDFIFTNPSETPGNFQDDDRNGYTDDIHGWDISDNDPDVSVPGGREDMFYHGTYIAGIIASVFREFYGEDARKFLQIIPVKVLSDHAQNKFLADGYKGIKYAADMGADIICCAWSGGQIGEEEKAILDAALAKGIIIIGAAGNFYTGKPDLPSSYPGVFCVAALATMLHKSRYSNYGMRVDVSAPGDSVYGPHPLADNAYIHENGTSPATAIVTGCAAIVKSAAPGASAETVIDAIRNTATPVDSLNLTWCGRLGAGLPDVAKAVDFIRDPAYKYSCFSSARPEGKIFFRQKGSPQSWNISPAGAYRGIHIEALCPEPGKTIRLYTGDSLWYDGPVEKISKMVFVPGSRFKIELDHRRLPRELELGYYMETIDSTTLYCKDIQYRNESEGAISDGSDAESYANNCSCKWQITVPAHKRVRIEFSAIDTQPNVDYIWIFDGTSTLQENLLAKFSGTSLPPVITTFSNKALVWFVSDNHTTGQGWTMKYSSVDQ